MTKVLAVVVGREGRLPETAFEVVGVANRLAGMLDGSVHALVLAPRAVREEAARLGEVGARKVTVVAHEALLDDRPEPYLELVEGRLNEECHGALLLPATSLGKDLAARLAAKLDVPLAQDVVGLEDEDGDPIFVRPVYAGKAIARLRLDASPLVATVRPHAFPVVEQPTDPEVRIVEADLDRSGWATELVSFERINPEVPDVAEASIVVSGGRGLKGPENWHLLEELRAALGPDAALGASRAVVDAGWRPHSEQVGQTGKTVTPRLYFAVGISGAVQHLAGMRTAGRIVAINRDPDAPIFRVADYGIVGDLFEVVPALTEEVRRLKGEA